MLEAERALGISDWCSLQYIEKFFENFYGQFYKIKPEKWCSHGYTPNSLPGRKYKLKATEILLNYEAQNMWLSSAKLKKRVVLKMHSQSFRS